MPRPRRLTALLVSFFLLHAMWAGSGFACTMSAMGQSSRTTMAAMDMSSADMTGMDMAGTAASGDMGHTPSHDHEPCNLPWAPAGCESMAPCGPTALASSPQLVRVPAAVPSAVSELAVLTPPSTNRSPEPPPPKA
jgi:hypothetical protein